MYVCVRARACERATVKGLLCFTSTEHTCIYVAGVQILWNPIGGDGYLFDNMSNHCCIRNGRSYSHSVSRGSESVQGAGVGRSGREYGS